MASSDLFDGIAVVIDDQIGKETGIDNLIKQIERKNMPSIKYKALPSTEEVKHFAGISFVLLDWKLQHEELDGQITQGVSIPDTLAQAMVDENIAFIKSIKETLFVPIFIFTNERIRGVIKALKKHNLYDKGKPNAIFVKNKRDLKGTKKLFNTLNDWMKDTPSIYVLKEWEKELHKAKVQLFDSFYEISPNWPKILWKTFIKDDVNASQELGDLISKNLQSRMKPFRFDGKILKKRGIQAQKAEIRSVLVGERFLENDGIDANSISPGDLFKLDDKFYLNIRPDCDCIPDRNSTNSSLDDVKLYLLKGEKLSAPKEKKAFDKKYGHFHEQDNQALVFCILDGKSFIFKFKEINIMQWRELKDKRIGRLLPPYITRVQQRYTLYLQRQGLPRTPEIAIG